MDKHCVCPVLRVNLWSKQENKASAKVVRSIPTVTRLEQTVVLRAQQVKAVKKGVRVAPPAVWVVRVLRPFPDAKTAKRVSRVRVTYHLLCWSVKRAAWEDIKTKRNKHCVCLAHQAPTWIKQVNPSNAKNVPSIL